GRGVAGGAQDDRAERFELVEAREAEIGNFVDLGLPEAAAKNVARAEVAMQDADGVNGFDTLHETTESVRRALPFERGSRLPDTEAHALLERRPLEASVHVLERNPRESRRKTRRVESPRVDEAHDEGRRRHVLVQTAERHHLFFHELAGDAGLVANDRGPENLH